MVDLNTKAKAVLDLFLFEDVYNNHNYHESEWDITFEGDNYVLLHRETGKLFPFRVTIEEHDWDYRQAVKDQEWDDEYDLEGFDE